MHQIGFQMVHRSELAQHDSILLADASTLAFLLIMARSWQVLCNSLVVHTQYKKSVLRQPQPLDAAIPGPRQHLQ